MQTFFLNDPPPLEIYPLPLHDALPILRLLDPVPPGAPFLALVRRYHALLLPSLSDEQPRVVLDAASQAVPAIASDTDGLRDRKSTRLNSSHRCISYAVFCLKKKNTN